MRANEVSGHLPLTHSFSGNSSRLVVATVPMPKPRLSSNGITGTIGRTLSVQAKFESHFPFVARIALSV